MSELCQAKVPGKSRTPWSDPEMAVRRLNDPTSNQDTSRKRKTKQSNQGCVTLHAFFFKAVQQHPQMNARTGLRFGARGLRVQSKAHTLG